MILRIAITLLLLTVGFSKQSQQNQNQQRFPHILWTFWDAGYDGASDFTKMCIHNMQHYTKLSGWEFRFLTLQNYTNYLSAESQNNLNSLLQAQNFKLVQQFADLIRLFVIHDNGGMWVDTNSVFLGNLSWIDKIHKQKVVYNNLYPNPEIITFTFNQRYGANKTIVFDEQLSKDVYLFPAVEYWGFVAKKHCLFLKDLIKILKYSLPKGIQAIFEENRKNGLIFGSQKHPYFFLSNYQFQVLLQKKQKQLQKYSSDQQNQIQSKYAVEYYKMWSIPAEQTTFKMLIKEGWFPFNTLFSLFQQSSSLVNNEQLYHPYFFKFSGQSYILFNLIFKVYNYLLDSSMNIQPDSIFNQFLLKPSPQMQANFQRKPFNQSTNQKHSLTTKVVLFFLFLVFVNMGIVWGIYYYKKSKTVSSVPPPEYMKVNLQSNQSIPA